MISRPLPIFLLLIASSFLMCCTTIVDFDFAYDKPAIVAGSRINPDSLFTVELSYAKYVLEQPRSYLPIEEAEVHVFEENSEIAVLPHLGNGIYSLSGVTPKAGKQYTIEITLDGYEKVSARTLVPEFSPILRLISIKEVPNGHGGIAWEFTINITDTPGETLYELSLIYIREFWDGHSHPPVVIDSGFVKSYIRTDDVVLGTDNTFRFSNSLLFDDHLISDMTYTAKFTVSSFNIRAVPLVEVPVTIVLKSVSQDYYFYEKSLVKQLEFKGDPFAEPVILYNNIESGIGIFSGYIQAVIDTIVIINP